MRKIKMGMIGGGQGAFIGAIHRMASGMDGMIELCCGNFSSDPQKSKASGKDLFLPEDRVYSSYREMIEKERALPEDIRMDFVSIVTPNYAHFEPAMLALDHGFHVVIEKPMTFTLQEAKDLQKKVKETGLLLCLTHTYAGYPMVKQARQLIAEGKLGKVRKIMAEYVQGWLSEPSEKEGNAQAAWRTDPEKSGIAGAVGDIGTHAAHLAEYISGLRITSLCADLNTVVPGRRLDDDGNILLKFENDAAGILSVSQIAAGEENNLTIRVYGEKGGLEWHQMEPNTLLVKWLDKPAEMLRAGTGNPSLGPFANHNLRTPGGHPEGYIEAFANIYRNFAQTLMSVMDNTPPSPEMLDFPGIDEGVRGMAFIENAVASGKSSEKWMAFEV